MSHNNEPDVQDQGSSEMDFEALLQLEFKKLQDEFLSKVPERLAEIETDWETAQDGINLEPLCQSVHRLRGTALTLGFKEMGNPAAVLEDAIRNHLSLEQLKPLYLELHREMLEPKTPHAIM